ncbi:hydrolase [Streptomyces sp. TS71-3]|uniref:alpha/beta hydrolase family protein n=1 Tax=Streptomyces sp. TS71-3 TaxID=2733862 RepID=UPI001B045914|nr:hydrolase [Streptomyces sp. TS71-3]GHJ40224.1 esterase [Streptomyces sp. TS71-3]
MPTRRAVLLSGAIALATVPAVALTERTASAARATTGSHAGDPAHAAMRTAAATGAGGALRLTLPAPTGPYALGTRALRLVDRSRPDPWKPTQPYRELMTTIRYPARDAAAYPAAPHMLPGEAAGFAALNNLAGIPADKVDWAATRTHAHQGAPVDERHAPYPVVLYSPGAGDPRSLGTVLCEDLASRGYVVVSVDHTYDAGAVEFPGGRVEKSVLPAGMAKAGDDPDRFVELLEKVTAVRVADTRFVLDRLGSALPADLRGVARTDRVGMFGQSAGGFTTLQTMHDDPRVAAGANLDGVLAYVREDTDPGHLSTVAADGLDRPFLLIGKDGDDLGTEPAWASLWRRSTGWHQGLALRGAEHATFTDAEELVSQIAARLDLPAGAVEENIGTIPPGRAITAGRAYLAAFFDRRLRGLDDHGLLDGPSARFPEARFFPRSV